MERRAVADVMDQLEREGKPISNLQIKRKLGYGSMRDIVKHRRALTHQEGGDGMPETETVTDDGLEQWQRGRRDSTGIDIRPHRPGAPAADPEPLQPWNMAYYTQVDPEKPDYSRHPAAANGVHGDPAAQVARADAHLTQCTQAFHRAKSALRDALDEIRCYEGTRVSGTRYGFALDDPERGEAEAVLHECQIAYNIALHDRRQAERDRDARVVQHRRARQEAWVQLNQPALPEAVEFWDVRIKGAPSDHMLREAKKNYAAALKAWQDAVALAPIDEETMHE